ncbi:hypothetical protein [Helicobacter bilis]|uniref:hypothetical protein n=1 Tax=Helicobacter bilis TaxID=37372 RepID=UPI00248DABFE|nr:hypothetical protein [Helicobacter bilis]
MLSLCVVCVDSVGVESALDSVFSCSVESVVSAPLFACVVVSVLPVEVTSFVCVSCVTSAIVVL